jgi:hypothetical protein
VTDALLWHTIRYPTTWQAFFGQIEGSVTGGPQSFTNVTCGTVDGQSLQVVGVGSDGQLWHTIRNAAGTWQNFFGQIEGAVSGGPPRFTAVACAGTGAGLQVVGVGSDGQLWHTIRNAAGTGWQNFFGLIEGGVTGGPPRFTDVSCGTVDGQSLQVVGVGSDGQLWHTIRNAAGTWQNFFGLIEGAVSGGPSSFTAVACAGTGAGLQLVGVGTGTRAIHWPTFTGTATPVGTSSSGRATIYYDATLGQAGLDSATALLNDADRVITVNDGIFGNSGGSVNVIVFALGNKTDGTGGADHMACDYVNGNNLEVDVAIGAPARVSGLFEAELSECNMGGNLCGVSTGEALSRWCAAVASNNALADFRTAPTWFADGMPNWVDTTFTGNETTPGDQNPDATGCGMAFISWLQHQGQTLNAIAQTMVTLGTTGTLAQLYRALTNDNAVNAWPTFQRAVNGLGNVTSDDPFGAMARAQIAHTMPRPRRHPLRPATG